MQYLSLPESPISSILSRLFPSESSSQTRSKAVYALSGLLKHNARGVRLLDESGGWKVLKAALEGKLMFMQSLRLATHNILHADPDITVRRKAVFLLSSLLIPSAPSESPIALPESSNTRLHGTAVPGASNPQQPEHPNSHAGMTEESTATSGMTSAALQEHGILGDLVQGLVNPVPHGKDGDHEGDADLEEKLVK